MKQQLGRRDEQRPNDMKLFSLVFLSYPHKKPEQSPLAIAHLPASAEALTLPLSGLATPQLPGK